MERDQNILIGTLRSASASTCTSSHDIRDRSTCCDHYSRLSEGPATERTAGSMTRRPLYMISIVWSPYRLHKRTAARKPDNHLSLRSQGERAPVTKQAHVQHVTYTFCMKNCHRAEIADENLAIGVPLHREPIESMKCGINLRRLQPDRHNCIGRLPAMRHFSKL